MSHAKVKILQYRYTNNILHIAIDTEKDLPYIYDIVSVSDVAWLTYATTHKKKKKKKKKKKIFFLPTQQNTGGNSLHNQYDLIIPPPPSKGNKFESIYL